VSRRLAKPTGKRRSVTLHLHRLLGCTNCKCNALAAEGTFYVNNRARACGRLGTFLRSRLREEQYACESEEKGGFTFIYLSPANNRERQAGSYNSFIIETRAIPPNRSRVSRNAVVASNNIERQISQLVARFFIVIYLVCSYRFDEFSCHPNVSSARFRNRGVLDGALSIRSISRDSRQNDARKIIRQFHSI